MNTVWTAFRYQCMEILHCMSKNRLDTKMLRVHLFSFFTILKTPWALAAPNENTTMKYFKKCSKKRAS